MGGNYTHATEEAKRFFVRISAEGVAVNAKIIGYSDRMGRITQRENPDEWDAIIKGIAGDLHVYAERVDGLLPDYQRNLELLTKGYAF